MAADRPYYLFRFMPQLMCDESNAGVTEDWMYESRIRFVMHTHSLCTDNALIFVAQKKYSTDG
jgi:hypothetical protein